MQYLPSPEELVLLLTSDQLYAVEQLHGFLSHRKDASVVLCRKHDFIADE